MKIDWSKRNYPSCKEIKNPSSKWNSPSNISLICGFCGWIECVGNNLYTCLRAVKTIANTNSLFSAGQQAKLLQI